MENSESIRYSIGKQTLFKEAIVAFHPEIGGEYFSNNPHEKMFNKYIGNAAGSRLYGYILLDFRLSSDWELPGGIVIERSIVINHGVDDGAGQECMQSFVSTVLLPDWVTAYNRQLFLQGLAAVVSFTTARSAYAQGSSFESIIADKLVPIEQFVEENRQGSFADIEGIKIVIKTDKGDIWGRFWKFRPIDETTHPVFSSHLSIQIDNTNDQFLVVKLDKNYNFIDIPHTPFYNPSTDEVLVFQINKFRQLAAFGPVAVLGRSSVFKIHEDVLAEWNTRLSNVISNLWKLPYKSSAKAFDYKSVCKLYE
ncbi:hypothetical protein [Pseudoalteromonas luteoviolacea]|uniref:hypothetical protein n=1 Tax=Pseudoalteromonas luteoviolacea TaxID=43657 RepID=UPI001B37DBC7|nr:hypothetical protein [Pseudoalteromonas luteoviolacea]MBQ4837093.1 hypothetical protein [Pseudoalteromonas luteoviolacea]